MKTISIDPSILNTGIAIFENQKLIEVYSCNGYKLALFLQQRLPEASYIVFEASNLQKAVWGRNMRCVGQVDAVCNLIRQAVKSHNTNQKKQKKPLIKIKEISPQQKGTKIQAEYIQQIYPNFKITQDISDAIKIGEWFCRLNFNM
jgi:hypothetical protein